MGSSDVGFRIKNPLWVSVWNLEAYRTLYIMVFIAYTFLYDVNYESFSLRDTYWKCDLLSMKFCLMCDDNRISVIKNWLKIPILVSVLSFLFFDLFYQRGLRIQQGRGYDQLYIHYTRMNVFYHIAFIGKILIIQNSYSWVTLAFMVPRNSRARGYVIF